MVEAIIGRFMDCRVKRLASDKDVINKRLDCLQTINECDIRHFSFLSFSCGIAWKEERQSTIAAL
jgi:hypothetical protein